MSEPERGEFEALAVFADALQAKGDPRGELLALELASARAPTSTEARAHAEAAAELRARVPELAWPEAAMASGVTVRAGFVVAATLTNPSSEFDTLLAPCFRHLRSLSAAPGQLDQVLAAAAAAHAETGLALDTLDELEPPSPMLDPVPLVEPAAMPLARLRCTAAPAAIASLSRLAGLERLDLGRPGPPAGLLDSLRALELVELGLDAPPDLLRDCLAHSPGLRALTLHEHPRPHGLVLDSPSLERLRVYGLGEPQFSTEDRLADAQLPRLRALALMDTCAAELDGLRRWSLEQLAVHARPGEGSRVAASLAALTSLEHLTLQYDVQDFDLHDISPLEGLARLRSLDLSTHVRGALRFDAGLDRLVLRAGTPYRLRIDGPIERIVAPRSAADELSRFFDTRALRVLEAGSLGNTERSRLARNFPQLQRLSLSGRWSSEAVAAVAEHPELRTVVVHGIGLAAQRELAERLPHLQILGALHPWQRVRELDPWRELDPLAARRWPKLEPA